MRLIKALTGYERDKLSDIQFRIMRVALAVRDCFFSAEKRLLPFALKEGMVVVDFGCGPGSSVESASKFVGVNGKVYAVDVQPLAIQSVEKIIRDKQLDNVVPVLAVDYPIDIADHSVDVIFALDMFHHVKETSAMLKELKRMIKPDGKLFIEGGHQPLNEAKDKILDSGVWLIVNEARRVFECKASHGK